MVDCMVRILADTLVGVWRGSWVSFVIFWLLIRSMVLLVALVLVVGGWLTL